MWLAAIACLGLAAGAAAWALWPRPAVVPQARQYLDVSACLLTGPQGVVPGSPSAPVWTSMEAASQATHVMVSYLPDMGHGDVPVLLSSLVQRRCGVIVTSGATPAQVVVAARANPHQKFVLVTGSTAAGVPGNTAVVSPAATN